MRGEKETKRVYILTIVLLVIGVCCYAFFSKIDADNPPRYVYKVAAGNVMFSHNIHHSPETGYGIACGDCHHHPADDESALVGCGECHAVSDDQPPPVEGCLACHDNSDLEGVTLKKRSEILHDQCIGCHEASDVDVVDCNTCHAMKK